MDLVAEPRRALLDWQFDNLRNPAFFDHWKLPPKRATELREWLADDRELWLDIGAGSGDFFLEQGEAHPEILFLAVERDRHRGKALERRVIRSGLPNVRGMRGNGVPLILHSVPDNRASRVHFLYPTPWTKGTDSKKRWYLSPFMEIICKKLRPGGRLVWASDQEWYVADAAYTCAAKHPFDLISFEKLPADFQGRTKFERHFLKCGVPCYQAVLEKRDDLPDTARRNTLETYGA